MSTPKDVFAEIDQRLKADPAATKEIDGAFKFDVSGADGGVWVVDCRAVEVKEGDGDADVTIAVSDEDLVAIGENSELAMQYFMLGKIQVEGDMGLAMKLQSIL
ncbi:MAG: SCP2 sterol-binding domain-containing protein [Myxococcales bacterium]|nr:SCP2 sterol-binding domain-containing protein [Myxococcales bacterium]MCB9733459.1 SCP2 sterol-binding domain-containing protein [Deltaproteobacteria bacterium]